MSEGGSTGRPARHRLHDGDALAGTSPRANRPRAAIGRGGVAAFAGAASGYRTTATLLLPPRALAAAMPPLALTVTLVVVVTLPPLITTEPLV